MKFLLLLGLTLVITKSNAQTDTAKTNYYGQLKKGIYANYKEFVNNSPSITWDFAVNRQPKSKTDSTIISAGFKFTEKGKFVKRLWGFSDGEYVYINFGNLSSLKNYWRLEHIGKYPFFTYEHSKKVIPRPTILTVITAVTAISTNGRYGIKVVNEKGNAKSPDYDLLKKLLSSQPDLLNSFEQEWARFARFDYPTYDIITVKDLEEKTALIKKHLVSLNDRLK